MPIAKFYILIIIGKIFFIKFVIKYIYYYKNAVIEVVTENRKFNGDVRASIPTLPLEKCAALPAEAPAGSSLRCSDL